MKRLTTFIILICSLNILGQSAVKIISGLKENDSLSFSVRRIDCISTDDGQTLDYFKLVRTGDKFRLLYRHHPDKLKEIVLRPEQILFIKRLEMSRNISTSYDRYSLKKKSKIEEFSRPYAYTDTLRRFFD